jgi:CRISPR type I-E-associated protein CasB/Cse2
VSQSISSPNDGAPAKDESHHDKRRRVLGALRHRLQRADPGELSSLRRSEPASPPPAFFRIAVDLLDDVLPPQGPRRDALESRWALLAKVIATALGTSPSTGGLLGNVPFGEALARADVAEMRLLRLLEAHEGQLDDLVRQVVAQLASKGQPFSINDLADLVLDHGSDHAESARRRIARSFYRSTNA